MRINGLEEIGDEEKTGSDEECKGRSWMRFWYIFKCCTQISSCMPRLRLKLKKKLSSTIALKKGC